METAPKIILHISASEIDNIAIALNVSWHFVRHFVCEKNSIKFQEYFGIQLQNLYK